VGGVRGYTDDCRPRVGGGIAWPRAKSPRPRGRRPAVTNARASSPAETPWPWLLCRGRGNRHGGNALGDCGNAFRSPGNEFRRRGNEFRRRGGEFPGRGNAFPSRGNSFSRRGNSFSRRRNSLRSQGNSIRRRGNAFREPGNSLGSLGNSVLDRRQTRAGLPEPEGETPPAARCAAGGFLKRMGSDQADCEIEATLASFRPAAWRSSAAFWVLSQVKPSSSRPKWP